MQLEHMSHGTYAAVPPSAWRKHGADLQTWDRAISASLGVALGAWALQRRDRLGLAAGAVGAALLARAIIARDPLTRAMRAGPIAEDKAEQLGWTSAALISRSVTVNRPRQELYEMWRDFERLPLFLDNIDEIEAIDSRCSRWKVRGPGGITLEWVSEIVEDEPGRRIAWRSAEGADIRNTGEVEFEDAAGGRGAIVRANIFYEPPGGNVGRAVAALFQREPALQARRDLRRFKQFMETGEVATAARRAVQAS